LEGKGYLREEEDEGKERCNSDAPSTFGGVGHQKKRFDCGGALGKKHNGQKRDCDSENRGRKKKGKPVAPKTLISVGGKAEAWYKSGNIYRNMRPRREL